MDRDEALQQLADQLQEAKYAVLRRPDGRLYLALAGPNVVIFEEPLAEGIETLEQAYAAMPHGLADALAWMRARRSRGFQFTSALHDGEGIRHFGPPDPWRYAWAERIAGLIDLPGYPRLPLERGTGDILVLVKGPPPFSLSTEEAS